MVEDAVRGGSLAGAFDGPGHVELHGGVVHGLGHERDHETGVGEHGARIALEEADRRLGAPVLLWCAWIGELDVDATPHCGSLLARNREELRALVTVNGLEPVRRHPALRPRDDLEKVALDLVHVLGGQRARPRVPRVLVGHHQRPELAGRDSAVDEGVRVRANQVHVEALQRGHCGVVRALVVEDGTTHLAQGAGDADKVVLEEPQRPNLLLTESTPRASVQGSNHGLKRPVAESLVQSRHELDLSRRGLAVAGRTWGGTGRGGNRRGGEG